MIIFYWQWYNYVVRIGQCAKGKTGWQTTPGHPRDSHRVSYQPVGQVHGLWEETGEMERLRAWLSHVPNKHYEDVLFLQQWFS